MKTQLALVTLFAVLSSALSFTAQASPRHTGAPCGLADDTGDDGWVMKHRDLSNLTNAQLLALPSVLQEQLVLTARENIRVYPDVDRSRVRNVLSAMQLLREWSSDGEVRLSHITYAGTRYTQIVGFPGDNEYGVIFFTGTTQVAGVIGDGEIVCAK